MGTSTRLADNANSSESGLIINGTRLAIYLGYCAVLAGCYVVTLNISADLSQTETLALAFAIGAVVPSCTIFRRELDLLEPIYWFSAMYFMFFIGAVYFILTDFQYAEHNLIDDPAVRNRALAKSLLLALIGYAVFFVGYLAATIRRQRVRIDFQFGEHVPDWLIGSAIFVLVTVGLLNFAYLIANYPGGLVKYYTEFGLRTHRLEFYVEGVTTAGLTLIYAAVWLWLFMLLRRIRHGEPAFGRQTVFFLFVALGSVAIHASQGRLFQTVSYCLSLAAMVYAFSDNVRRNSAMLVVGAGTVVAGLGLYFGRLLSLLVYNKPEILSSLGLSGVIEMFFRALSRFILDAGNVTDLTSLMNIIAYWEQDFGFLLGSSFLSPLSRLIDGIEYQGIAEMTQPKWSTGTGAWPPTFVGELYANFGAVGVVGGMLIAGFLIGRVYVWLASRRNFWTSLILCSLTFRFFFVLPKGEMVNLIGAFWLAIPAIVTFGALKLFQLAARREH